MVKKIKIKRGLKKDLPTLDLGEYGLTTDESKVYIGGTDGNVGLVTDKELTQVNTNLTTQLAQKALKREFDAREFVPVGMTFPNPDWTVNRDAFQAANDAAFAIGGGRVVAPPGEYLIKDLIQDSRVEFYLPEVTFKNPDGLSIVIKSRQFETVGNAIAGNNTVTVSSLNNIEVGTVVIIHRAGGILNTHFSALTNDIDTTTTTITIDQNDGKFPTSGYMQVGTELIGYTSISGTSLVGVTRGALGTTPAAHFAGDFIGVARHFYTEVTDINGNTLTLSDTVPFTATNTKIDIGILRPSIKGLKIDVNKIPGGHSSSVYGIAWMTTRWGDISNIEIINGDMGGLYFGKGTTDSYVNGIRLHDCGVWGTKGAGLWLFQGCRRNRINNLSVSGKGWVGFYIDDRTSVAEPYDASNDDNYITSFTIDLIKPPTGYPPAFIIVGSSRNKVINGFVRGTSTGVEIDHGAQYLTADGSLAIARDNEIAGVHFDVGQPWILNAPGNRLHECTYTDRATSVPKVSPGNLVYAVTNTKGQSVNVLSDISFLNGTANTPGINFSNEKNTGFYRDGVGVMHISMLGQKRFSFYQNEFRFQDGAHISTGTEVGTKIGLYSTQKIGFYGKTPMSQPAAITNKTGQTLEQVEAELNLVKTTLRNLGLIAT